VATVMPPFTADRGNDSLLDALAHPYGRRRIENELRRPWKESGIENFLYSVGPSRLVLGGFQRSENTIFEGKALSEIAALRHSDPIDTLLDLVEAERGNLRVTLFSIDPEGIDLVAEWPW